MACVVLLHHLAGKDANFVQRGFQFGTRLSPLCQEYFAWVAIVWIKTNRDGKVKAITNHFIGKARTPVRRVYHSSSPPAP